MFVLLLVGSLLLAFALSASVSWLCARPIDTIANRFVGERVGSILAKYMRFAIIVVGITAGTRVRPLEEYIAAPNYSKAKIAQSVTQEFWALELYRAFIETLQGIGCLFLLVIVIALLTLFVVRKTNPQLLEQVEEKTPTREQRSKITRLR